MIIRNMNIIPALLERDFLKLEERLSFLKNIKNKYNLDFDIVQIDICDGEFVENPTWIPDASEYQNSYLNSFKDDFHFEYHLMCKDIKKYFLLIKDLNCKSLVIHIDDYLLYNTGEEYYLELLKYIKDLNKKFIITANTKNITENKEKFLSFINNIQDLQEKIFIQIMGIEHVGMQGQEFDQSSLEIVDIFKESEYRDNIYFQIDGGVNINSISKIKHKDIKALVVGSFLMNSKTEEEFLENYSLLSF